VKTDIRALRDRVDTRADRLESREDRLESRVDCVESKTASQFIWLISLHLALAVGMLGAMARGFGWI
jgi:hypothetical protein